MLPLRHALACFLLPYILFASAIVFAEEPTVESVARQARQSLAVITVAGRDESQQGLGAGFVIDAGGLIATNLHVVGEGRPVRVKLADNREFDVTEVFASDASQDLAIVKIEASELAALPLGDSESVEPGRPVVAMGNPHGLAHSVVAGVVSGRRDIDDRKMLQLALPIEPGNSGGPVLDMQGQVLGVVTMKSAVTENLGFAMEVNALKTLLEKPNPIPMERWLTIGALDKRVWKPLQGARWRQSAGRITVSGAATGAGAGFGGRAICLYEAKTPPLPFEVGVWVKLDDESGAAGLVLHSDGGDKHYGFYPSNGRLRFTRFDGPDVFSWTVLREEPSPAYKRGEWNHLKVRVAEGKFSCHVNDQLVYEIEDDALAAGKLGLAKFRDTQAQFKQFRAAEKLPAVRLDESLAARLSEAIAHLPDVAEVSSDTLSDLASETAAGGALLRDEARKLEQRAVRLKSLANELHAQRVAKELAEMLSRPEAEIDLARAALLIAWLDDEECDVDAYRQQIDRLGQELAERLPAEADAAARREALHKYLFEENGFHGSRSEYYHAANSHLSRVLDDREGLPITLSVLYLELAQRAGMEVAGVGLPGHFVVKQILPQGEEPSEQLIDVFDRGALLSRDDAEEIVRGASGRPLDDSQLVAATKKAIVLRMLSNLIGLAQQKRDSAALLRYLEAWLAIDPEAAQERGLRAVVRFESGRRAAAIADLDVLLEQRPEGADLDRIAELREYFSNAQPPVSP